MNRKGMLLIEETLKMILAVIAIGFLIYFLVSLYFTRVQGNELNQANAELNRIRIVANGVNGVEEVPISNPVGWYVFSFAGELKSPNACAGENCLCICEKVSGFVDFIPFGEILPFVDSHWERQFNECNDNGACLGISNLKPFGGFEIEKDLTMILINKEDGEVVISK